MKGFSDSFYIVAVHSEFSAQESQKQASNYRLVSLLFTSSQLSMFSFKPLF